ncbi:hypothetical protein [Streptomyces nondiastaticus]|uniref:Uncharacterized protein n=1 Tax=Streptomyces nondiastaticus TaxID=3154512 RepID=A0ABW6U4M6_9ACTN
MAHSITRGRRHAANVNVLSIREDARELLDINCLADFVSFEVNRSIFAGWHGFR